MATDGPYDPTPRAPSSDLSQERIGRHVARGRRRISRLGEIRELIFGAQDGLVSTLAVVATVSAATSDRLAVLVAGLASAMAGVFSMAIGEYTSSKSQAEIFQFHIEDEKAEVADRPDEAEAELAYMFMEEGMPREDADAAAAIIRRHPRSLLATMVAKEFGLIHDAHERTAGTPLRGAVVMGAAFAAGGIVPVVPFLLTGRTSALLWSVLLTGGVLFGLGAAKSRWSQRSWLRSGTEILMLAALAGAGGYVFGSLLPTLLGFAT